MASTKKVFEKVLCKDCVFWQKFLHVPGCESGLCNRYPPTVIACGEDHDTYLPDTNPMDWCGEGRTK